jgi:hypothetical protein
MCDARPFCPVYSVLCIATDEYRQICRATTAVVSVRLPPGPAPLGLRISSPMPGYAGDGMLSAMDVSAKLQIKPGQTVSVVNIPPGLAWPVAPADENPASADVVIGFAATRRDLNALGAVIDAARADRLAWIGYPKAGRLGTDLNRDLLVKAVSGLGVQPVRHVSIDDTWSALRFRPS